MKILKKHVFMMALVAVSFSSITFAALWIGGVLDLSSHGDDLPTDRIGDTSQASKEDQTNLSELTPLELAEYYYQAFLQHVARDRDDIREAVAHLSPQDIDLLCAKFKEEPTGEGLTKYALVLADAGTEKALRTIGSFYERPDLLDSMDDFQITLCLITTRHPVAREVLLKAYCNLQLKELRKVVGLGLGAFKGDDEIGSLLIQRIPLVESDECDVLLVALGILSTDAGVQYLQRIAQGELPELNKYREKAVNAFRRCRHPKSPDVLLEIALHPNCQDYQLQYTSISVFGDWAVAGLPTAIDV